MLRAEIAWWRFPRNFYLSGCVLLMLLEGILLGISLSFLVGPLLFAVLEAGIAHGFRAGIAVASGIWVSDMLFVALILWSVQSLAALVQGQGFRFWAGIFGGILLIAFGAVSYFSGAKNKKTDRAQAAASSVRDASGTDSCNYFHLWLRGFLINTINPGTIFFWIGIVSAVVAPRAWKAGQSLVFFSGMLGTLIMTDTLKAWGARSIRRFLTPAHIRQVQKGIGLVLALFGMVLMYRATWGM